MNEVKGWCFTAHRPRLWLVDARAIYPLGLWLLHWRYWTLVLAFLAILFLVVLDKMGLPPNAAGGYLRARLLGRFRPVSDTATLRRRARW